MNSIEIIRLNTIDSTNDYLKKLAKNGQKENTVVVADSQTKGKGTRGRSFISDEGGVYMSILIHPNSAGFDATLVTSMTAVAVSRTIEQICNKTPQIKWVNDVYLDNKKVCGILCESVVTGGEMPFVVVGIGVNLFKPKNDFSPEIKDIATYIFAHENAEIKQKFEKQLLQNFFTLFEELKDKTFLSYYRGKNLVLGKKIRVILGDETSDATALEIDESCRLLVEFSDKTQKYLSSGEVQIKLP